MVEDMEPSAPPAEESGNRMFLIGAIILGGIFIVALISIFALYFLTRGGQPAAPQPQNQTATAAFQVGATQTYDAQGTQTKIAQALQTAAITATSTPQPTASGTVTPTPVVFATIAVTLNTPTETEITGGGGLTPIVTATRTPLGATPLPVVPTRTATRTRASVPTALPQTGIGDAIGFPMLIVVGGVSMIVIILTRQIRLGRKGR
jgi:hypothetical protein